MHSRHMKECNCSNEHTNYRKELLVIIEASKNDASEVDILYFFCTSSDGYKSFLVELQMTICL